MGCSQSSNGGVHNPSRSSDPKNASAADLLANHGKKKPLTDDEIAMRIDMPAKTLYHEIDGTKFRYAWVSQRGYYPEALDKDNQDAYVVHTKFGGADNQAFFGVFDGHGKDGHHCARYVRDNLPKKFLERLERCAANTNPRTIKQALTVAHYSTNEAVHSASDFDDSLSGTTSLSIFFRGGRDMYVSNVGDSRAILLSSPKLNAGSSHRGEAAGKSEREAATEDTEKNGESKSSSDLRPEQIPLGKRVGVDGELESVRLVASPLSSDQTPYRRDERERVKRFGARVLSMDQIEGIEPIHENWGDLNLGEDIDEGGDPPRVWSPNGDYPGTAFTRSLGDLFAEECGVVAEPEILIREMEDTDKCVILASDGVFEFLTNQMIADIIGRYADPLDACRAVVQAAYDMWLQYEVRTDDITIIAIFVDAVKPAPSAQLHGTGNSGAAASSLSNSSAASVASAGSVGSGASGSDSTTKNRRSSFSISSSFFVPALDPTTATLATAETRPVRRVISREKRKHLIQLRDDEDEDFLVDSTITSGSTGLHPSFALPTLVSKAAEDGSTAASATTTSGRNVPIIPKTEEEIALIGGAIKNNFLFQHLTPAQRAAVISVMQPVQVSAGDWIIRQGDVGDRFYVVDSGRYEVRVRPQKAAAFAHKARKTIFAAPGTDSNNDNNSDNAGATAKENNNSSSTTESAGTEADENKQSGSLVAVASAAAAAIVSAVTAAGGGASSAIEEGEDEETEEQRKERERAELQLEIENSNVVHVYESGVDQHPGFGELSLMYGKPRAASVIALSDGKLWSLDRRIFKGVVLRPNTREHVRKDIIRTIKRVKLLNCLNLQQLQRLTDLLVEERFTAGSVIATAQSTELVASMTSERFYIVRSGVCEVEVTLEANPETKSGSTSCAKGVVKHLGVYDYFGQSVLLGAAPPSSSVDGAVVGTVVDEKRQEGSTAVAGIEGERELANRLEEAKAEDVLLLRSGYQQLLTEPSTAARDDPFAPLDSSPSIVFPPSPPMKYEPRPSIIPPPTIKKDMESEGNSESAAAPPAEDTSLEVASKNTDKATHDPNSESNPGKEESEWRATAEVAAGLRGTVRVVAQTDVRVLSIGKQAFEDALGTLRKIAADERERARQALMLEGGNGMRAASRVPIALSEVKIQGLVGIDQFGPMLLGHFGASAASGVVAAASTPASTALASTEAAAVEAEEIPNVCVRSFRFKDVREQNLSSSARHYVETAKIVSANLSRSFLNTLVPRHLCVLRDSAAVHLVFESPIVADLSSLIRSQGPDFDDSASSSARMDAAGAGAGAGVGVGISPSLSRSASGNVSGLGGGAAGGAAIGNGASSSSAEIAAYTISCVASALETLHSMHIIYRSVQPESLCVDLHGRVVLIDYRCCKVGLMPSSHSSTVTAGASASSRGTADPLNSSAGHGVGGEKGIGGGGGGKTFTLCGAADYLAPEQVAQVGHSYPVDLWGMGVLLYELACGSHPFSSPSEVATYSKISAFGSKSFPGLKFPDHISHEIKALINQLLVPAPEARIGAGAGGFHSLKKHPLFKSAAHSLSHQQIQQAHQAQQQQLGMSESLTSAAPPATGVSNSTRGSASVATADYWSYLSEGRLPSPLLKMALAEKGDVLAEGVEAGLLDSFSEEPPAVTPFEGDGRRDSAASAVSRGSDSKQQRLSSGSSSSGNNGAAGAGVGSGFPWHEGLEYGSF